MKNNYALALEALAQKQKELGRPPKIRDNVRIIVKNLIIRFGLKGDPREQYFRLLATCAILGKETMYNSYKPKKKVRRP